MTLKLIALCFIGLGMIAAAGARAANPIVVLETSMGTVKIEVYEDKAPISAKNFLAYVNDKHFDGTIFHRAIEDFMVQGGGYDPGMKLKTTKAAIKNEASNGLQNVRGTLAMARTGDPDSATSQFFVNLKDNAFLDKANSRDGHGYCVFARVTEGMDIVDKMAKVDKTKNAGGELAVPKTDITIKTAKVEAKK